MKIFISHASEDRNAVARPLAKMLRDEGIEVLYDEYSLELGDSLRRGIDQGLKDCSYCVVILSKAFFSKKWPQKELDALATRESNEENKIILPVWHKITKEEIIQQSALLADQLGVSTSEGLPTVLSKILQVLKKDKGESKEVVYSFKYQNIIEWNSAIKNVFKGGRVTSKSWSNRDDIVKILNHVAKPNLNHCFFPSGGGDDLEGVSASLEKGCIELIFGPKVASIIKVKSLDFFYFTRFPSLSYFRIETLPLEPKVWTKEQCSRFYEELVEVYPMEYQDRSAWDEGVIGHDENGDEIELPEEARLVSRYIGGAFVIFAKGSFYNTGLNGKYDAYNAQHQKMNSSEFKEFILSLIKALASNEIEVEPDR